MEAMTPAGCPPAHAVSGAGRISEQAREGEAMKNVRMSFPERADILMGKAFLLRFVPWTIREKRDRVYQEAGGCSSDRRYTAVASLPTA